MPRRGMMSEQEMLPGAGGGMMPQMPQEGMGVPTEEAPEESNVSPEEQSMYDKFMENYYTIMYIGSSSGESGGKPTPAADNLIEEYFSGDFEPVDALANAAVTTVKYLADSAEAAGKPISPDILMHVGVEVIEDMAQLAESPRVKFYEYSQEQIDGALYRAMDLYRELEQGSNRLNMDEIKGDFDSMMKADKEGKLDEMLPGITEAALEMPNPEMEEGVSPEPQSSPPQAPPGMMRR